MELTNNTLGDGLSLIRVFWVRGVTPKGSTYEPKVSDPPCNGWQNALLLSGEKRSTLFCPYSFNAYQVPSHADEIVKSVPQEVTPKRKMWIRDKLRANWDEFQTLGLMKDYDTAAVVFRRLDMEPPAQLIKGGEEDKTSRGGKEPADRLLKPVRRKGKRGDFLAYFLDNFGSRSVREAMADLEMTRSNVLSYLYTINKDHGIGYTLVGDTAEVILPDGVTEVFDAPSA